MVALYEAVNIQMNKLEWFYANKLSLNATKTSCIVIKTQQR